ncbi:MAG: hypothetical protein EAY75_09705 [Bacteroidetes bacterium]|nr:MAG: hypothetical protein EAY75_09705 [Bacteroidota bacterium]
MKTIFSLLILAFLAAEVIGQNVGIGNTNPAFRLDVTGRARIRASSTNPNDAAGFWMDDYRNGSNTAFFGMADSIRMGMWGQLGAGWKLRFDAKNGNLSFGDVVNTSTARVAISSTGSFVNYYRNTDFTGSVYSTDTSIIYTSAYGFTPICFIGSPCPAPTPAKDIIFNPPSFFLQSTQGSVGFFVNKPNADLHVSGNMLIGSAASQRAVGYSLSVDGKIMCEELKVQLSTAWPDYVFEPGYTLENLDVLERQVMQQKHLPGIPSAADVQASNGIALGDLQKRMLEKVEELYRHVFTLNAENKALKARLDQIEKK